MSTTSDIPEGSPEETLPKAHEALPEDFEKALLRGLVQELLRRVSTPLTASSMTAAEMQLIRQLCQDNSISFSSIKRGDFGQMAQRVAEEFPFDQGGNVVAMGGRP